MAGTVKASVLQHDVTGAAPVIRDGAGNEIGRLLRVSHCYNSSTSSSTRGSFNVSSITRNGTGDNTTSFSNALPSSLYSVSTAINSYSATNIQGLINIYATDITGGGIGITSSTIRCLTAYSSSAAAVDWGYIHVTIFAN